MFVFLASRVILSIPQKTTRFVNLKQGHINPTARVSFLWIVDFLRVLIDVTTYWSQLVITFAIAIERYILIFHGTESMSILSPHRRRKFYSVVVCVVFLLPLCVMVDLCINYETPFRDAYGLYRDYGFVSTNETTTLSSNIYNIYENLNQPPVS